MGNIFLALPLPVIKINGQLQANLGRMTNGLDPLRMKFWVNPASQEPKAKCLLKAEGVQNELEEGKNKYQV